MQKLIKPYNIVMDGDTGATINLYGEVVQTRPLDWWTGEPVPGNFIAVDEFLKDLDELTGKDEITVHINSVGGDMYGGIAIYNRLKGLAAHVTTVNDGLAASAGSLIFMAGDTRKVNAGSNIMIHGAAGFLYGYYQVQDLRASIKQLEAHNKAGINIYAERTGRPVEEIKPLVDRETWLTGQDAVEQGFADEVIGEEAVTMKLTPDKSRLMVNGMAVAARCLGNIPDTIQQMTPEEWEQMSTQMGCKNPHNNSMPPENQDVINTPENGGKEMEIKTVEELRNQFPDFVAQIENAAKNAAHDEGVKAERERIKGIEDIEAAIGDANLVNEAKYGEKPMNAEQLAFAAMKAQAAIGASMLEKMGEDAKNSGAGNVSTNPANMTEEERAKAEEEQTINMIASNRPKKEGK